MQPLHNKSDDPKLEARLTEILDLLYSFYDTPIDMSLERVERFLAQLDNPHLKLPPVIHVAGTNGKGSTIACLRSILEAHGKRVHVVTSPHLVHPTERIRLAGELIFTQELVDVLEECLAVNRAEPITFFEMFMAASFLVMSRVPADYVILETGMGGRLDATNVIPNPVCTIITTISKDHEKFLGDTLDKIAFEKAGIMKVDVPCVIGKQTNEEVITVFENRARELNAPLYLYDRAWCEGYPTSNLVGEHQIYNCGVAIQASKIILSDDFDAELLSFESKDNPLKNIHWPGRLQNIMEGHLYDLLQDDQELWLDGGHNDSAGVALAKQCEAWQEDDNHPLHLIVAMVNRKIPAEFLEPLAPYTDSITVTSIPEEASSYSADELYDLVQSLGFNSVNKAKTTLEAIKAINDPNARILITGSLYFVGYLLGTQKICGKNPF